MMIDGKEFVKFIMNAGDGRGKLWLAKGFIFMAGWYLYEYVRWYFIEQPALSEDNKEDI